METSEYTTKQGCFPEPVLGKVLPQQVKDSKSNKPVSHARQCGDKKTWHGKTKNKGQLPAQSWSSHYPLLECYPSLVNLSLIKGDRSPVLITSGLLWDSSALVRRSLLVFKQGVAGVSGELLWVLRIKTGGGREGRHVCKSLFALYQFLEINATFHRKTIPK